MATTDESNQNIFPYKTFLWILFAGFAIFIFKDELKSVISDAEELSVFGVNIKTTKKKANELESKINAYQEDIASLTSNLSEQQIRMDSLIRIKEDLLKNLAECPEAKSSTLLLNSNLKQFSRTNIEIESQSEKLNQITILKRQNNLQKVDLKEN